MAERSASLNASPLRFIKNAASNVLNGASTALLAILLPYVLVKHFSPTVFGLWVLMLQLGGYANYLNLGVQTAVGRYVAEALSLGNEHRVGAIVTAGTQFLLLLAALAVVMLVGIAIFFGDIFPQLEPSLLPIAQSSVLWIGGAFVLALPASALLGVFIGVQRNEIPAYAAVGSRLLIGSVTAAVAALTQDLRLTSIAFFIASAMGFAAQYWLYSHCFPNWSIRLSHVDRRLSAELAAYCASLAVWSLSMLLVNGLSITLVGIIDFKNLAYFGIAVSLVTFLVGIQQSIFSPLIQIFAANHARQDFDTNRQLLISTSMVCSSLLLLIAAILFCFGKTLLTSWVGAEYAKAAFPFLVVLVIGNVIRYSATPYALWLIAAGHQKKVIVTPFIEGLVNLGVSVAVGYNYGAIGIAYGVVAGGLVGIAANFLFNIPRTLEPSFSRSEYGLRNLLLPAAVAVVAMLSSALSLHWGAGDVTAIAAAIAPPLLYFAYTVWWIVRTRSAHTTAAL